MFSGKTTLLQAVLSDQPGGTALAVRHVSDDRYRTDAIVSHNGRAFPAHTIRVSTDLLREGLMEYDELCGIQWDWQRIDGAITKAPLGGGKNRKKPYRSRQIGHETKPAYGWRRRTVVGGRGRRQCA